MADRADLVIPQGKAWTGPTWALIGEDGGPVDLTGRLVQAQVRATPRDYEVLWEWSTDRGNVHVSQVTIELEDGTSLTTAAVAFLVKPTESAGWDWTLGVYDCELSTPGDPDSVSGIVELSSVRVEAEVTR